MNTWVGRSVVEAVSGERKEKYSGAYGLVVFSSTSLQDGIMKLSDELLEQGVRLRGFDWLLQEDDIDRVLDQKELNLIEKLSLYPVQFDEFHWFP